MVIPNMSDPFLVDIVAVFLGNVWQTNAVNNLNIPSNWKFYYHLLKCSKGTGYLEGQIRVTFYLPLIV